MPKVLSNRRCCGCVNLRTGCLIVTSFQMIIGLLTGLLTIVLLALLRSTNSTSYEGHTIQSIRIASYVLLGIEIVCATIGFLGLWGTYKSKTKLLLVYLIVDALCIILWFAGVVVTMKDRNALWGIQFSVMMLLQIYFYFPVHSYRQEILQKSKYVCEVVVKC